MSALPKRALVRERKRPPEVAVDTDALARQIDLDELARYVVILKLRRSEYCDKYEAFSHQLLLRMQSAGVKSIDVGDYTIRSHAATNRKESSCYQCGHVLGDNNQPARISIKKRESDGA